MLEKTIFDLYTTSKWHYGICITTFFFAASLVEAKAQHKVVQHDKFKPLSNKTNTIHSFMIFL